MLFNNRVNWECYKKPLIKIIRRKINFLSSNNRSTNDLINFIIGKDRSLSTLKNDPLYVSSYLRSLLSLHLLTIFTSLQRTKEEKRKYRFILKYLKGILKMSTSAVQFGRGNKQPILSFSPSESFYKLAENHFAYIQEQARFVGVPSVI